MNHLKDEPTDLIADETPADVAVKDAPVKEPVLEKIAAGDESALESCLNQYGGLVWTMAKRMCGNDADDATQEIFMEIWQKAGQYHSDRGSEGAFIATITRRRLIDRLRRKTSALESSDDFQLEIACVEDVDRLELADEASKAAECMNSLSQPQQKILTLSIHHGTSHAGISKRLGMPLGTVKSFARRALIQLRDCMQRPVADIDGGLS